MSAGLASAGRNAEIEALRATAIALTLLQHVPQFFPKDGVPFWVKWIYEHFAFWSGVDLFFAISGFVVAHSLLRGFAAAASAGRSHWSEVKRFWIRRAFRLLPVAACWLAVVLLATVAFNRSGVFGDWDSNVRQAWWIVAYAYNWVAQPMAAAGTNIAPLSVYWSLSLEEQFYVALPLLLLCFTRRAIAWGLAFLIAIQFFVWRPAPLVEFWWMVRCDALAWGVLLALLLHARGSEWLSSRVPISRAMAWTANWLLLLAILVLPLWWFKASITTGVVAIACATWVGLAACERGWVLPGCVNARATDWLATRSYALYLAHVPCYMAVNELAYRFDSTGWESILIRVVSGVLLACVAAELSYRWIETPLREYGRRLAATLK